MNDTLLALLSALAIYGFSTLALPTTGWDTDDEIAALDDDAPETPSQRDGDDDSTEIG